MIKKEDINRVNHPQYYVDKSGIECIDIAENRTFNIGSCLKYLWRAGLKCENGMSDIEKQIEDLDKASFYINAEKNRLMREHGNSAGSVVVKTLSKNNGNTKVLCRCLKCGKEYETWMSHFYNGFSKCGCDICYSERLHSIWENMLQRCNNPKCPSYGNYGGRGISVCVEWEDYANFLEWSKNNGYKESLEIDRINNEGNYEPLNCRWVTRSQNVRNRRVSVNIEVNGISKPLVEWCEIYSIPFRFAQSHFDKCGHDKCEMAKFITEYNVKKHRKLNETIPVQKISMTGEVIEEYPSLTEAAKENGIKFGNLRYWLSLENPKSKAYRSLPFRFRYKYESKYKSLEHGTD